MSVYVSTSIARYLAVYISIGMIIACINIGIGTVRLFISISTVSPVFQSQYCYGISVY